MMKMKLWCFETLVMVLKNGATLLVALVALQATLIALQAT